MRRLPVLMALFVLTALAADVAGTWKVSAQGGAMERTFVFKVDGSKLTGETTSSMVGKSTINDGKIDGDSLSFTIMVNFQGNEMKVSYSGKVSGDAIKMAADNGGGRVIQWEGKKVQ